MKKNNAIELNERLSKEIGTNLEYLMVFFPKYFFKKGEDGKLTSEFQKDFEKDAVGYSKQLIKFLVKEGHLIDSELTKDIQTNVRCPNTGQSILPEISMSSGVIPYMKANSSKDYFGEYIPVQVYGQYVDYGLHASKTGANKTNDKIKTKEMPGGYNIVLHDENDEELILAKRELEKRQQELAKIKQELGSRR